MGLVGVALKIYQDVSGHTAPHFSPTNPLYKDWVSVLAFAALAYSLYHFARKPIAGTTGESEVTGEG